MLYTLHVLEMASMRTSESFQAGHTRDKIVNDT